MSIADHTMKEIERKAKGGIEMMSPNAEKIAAYNKFAPDNKFYNDPKKQEPVYTVGGDMNKFEFKPSTPGSSLPSLDSSTTQLNNQSNLTPATPKYNSSDFSFGDNEWGHRSAIYDGQILNPHNPDHKEHLAGYNKINDDMQIKAILDAANGDMTTYDEYMSGWGSGSHSKSMFNQSRESFMNSHLGNFDQIDSYINAGWYDSPDGYQTKQQQSNGYLDKADELLLRYADGDKSVASEIYSLLNKSVDLVGGGYNDNLDALAYATRNTGSAFSRHGTGYSSQNSFMPLPSDARDLGLSSHSGSIGGSSLDMDAITNLYQALVNQTGAPQESVLNLPERTGELDFTRHSGIPNTPTFDRSLSVGDTNLQNLSKQNLNQIQQFESFNSTLLRYMNELWNGGNQNG